MNGVHSSPSRWVGATLTGYYRSAVLLAVAGLVPAITIAVASSGSPSAGLGLLIWPPRNWYDSWRRSGNGRWRPYGR